jgi:hypothetical protein
MRYRCHVIARTALDVVSGVGGRLVDLAMAGWEVTVALADCSDTRPLRILGAAPVDLDWLEAAAGREGLPQLLNLAGDIDRGDGRVLCGVRSALVQPQTEIATWGRDGAGEIDAEFGTRLLPRCHRLSAAGRAFKARALMAAGRSPLFEPAEPYWAAAPTPVHIHTCI